MTTEREREQKAREAAAKLAEEEGFPTAAKMLREGGEKLEVLKEKSEGKGGKG